MCERLRDNIPYIYFTTDRSCIMIYSCIITCIIYYVRNSKPSVKMSTTCNPYDLFAFVLMTATNLLSIKSHVRNNNNIYYFILFGRTNTIFIYFVEKSIYDSQQQ